MKQKHIRKTGKRKPVKELTSSILKPKRINKSILTDIYLNITVAWGCMGYYSEGCLNCLAAIRANFISGRKNVTMYVEHDIIRNENCIIHFTGKHYTDFSAIAKLPKLGKGQIMLTYFGEIAEWPIIFFVQLFSYINDRKGYDFVFITKDPDTLLIKYNKVCKILKESNVFPNKMRKLHVIVSVELDKYKHRIDTLRKFDIINKHIYFKPLLGDVGILDLTGIDSVHISIEGGYDPRQCKPEWIINIMRQCKDQGVSYTLDKMSNRKTCKKGEIICDVQNAVAVI